MRLAELLPVENQSPARLLPASQLELGVFSCSAAVSPVAVDLPGGTARLGERI